MNSLKRVTQQKCTYSARFPAIGIPCAGQAATELPPESSRGQVRRQVDVFARSGGGQVGGVECFAGGLYRAGWRGAGGVRT